MALPASQQERLGRNFEAEPQRDYRLDLVVLTNDESQRNFVPLADRNVQVHANPVFRMWERRKH